MPAQKLREFLDASGVRYTAFGHRPAVTAQEIAAAAHVPGREMAKTVIVRIDDELAMLVLPAPAMVDFGALQAAIDAETVELADEREFRNRFPECEVGAMPPFGNLFGMRTLVAESLADDDEIVFNAGSHAELIRMAFREYERLVRPERVDFVVLATP